VKPTVAVVRECSEFGELSKIYIFHCYSACVIPPCVSRYCEHSVPIPIDPGTYHPQSFYSFIREPISCHATSGPRSRRDRFTGRIGKLALKKQGQPIKYSN
jgi:hypothetical protein